jgi:hypothetical protein
MKNCQLKIGAGISFGTVIICLTVTGCLCIIG